MNYPMTKRNGVALVVIGVILLLLLKACPQKNPKTFSVDKVETKIYKDTTVYTIVDTQFVTIEKRIDKAVSAAEKQKEIDALKICLLEAKLVRTATTETEIIYDTLLVEPDSVMIYNVFEYNKVYNDGTVVHIDTIQRRWVSRSYAQKLIIQTPNGG